MQIALKKAGRRNRLVLTPRTLGENELFKQLVKTTNLLAIAPSPSGS